MGMQKMLEDDKNMTHERQVVSHGAGLQLKEKDFHAKPYCAVHGHYDLGRASRIGKPHDWKYLEKDVLVEREHYDQKLRVCEETLLEIRRHAHVNYMAEKKRAEAAEAELKTALEGFDLLHKGIEEQHQAELKKAEVRVKELEKAIHHFEVHLQCPYAQRPSDMCNECRVCYVKNRLMALAGEKTK